MALKLNIIIGSTRPGRKGPIVAKWFSDFAKAHGGFDVELVDLADFDLPVFNEPKHPRMRDYQYDATKKWSASVASADAFVFVTPEYNYFAPPALINALTYVAHEWAYKPAGIVSYGGVSGGLRAAQSLRLILPTLKLMPIPEGVPVPFFANMIEDDTFKPTEPVEQGAKLVLDELARWAGALKPLHAA